MKRFITILTVSLALLTASYALAADVNLVYKPPCLLPGEVGTFGPCVETTSSIAQYLVNLYRFGMGIAGILAVGMIVGGSVYMSVSSSSIDKKSEGREMITSALIGIGLLFGSYILLNTINPELVKLKDPAIKAIVSTSTYSGGNFSLVTGVTGCPVDAILECSKTTGSVLYTKYNTTTIKAAEGTQKCFGSSSKPDPSSGYVYCLDGASLTDVQNKQVYCSQYIDQAKTPSYFDDCLKAQIENSTAINDEFNIKPNQCKWGKEPSVLCQIDGSNTFLKKLQMFRDIIASESSIERKDWWVTEAYPPTIHHADSCHTKGTCVDINLTNPVGNDSEAVKTVKCSKVQKMLDTLARVGLNVVNEYSSCPGTSPAPQSTTFGTGSHIHIEN